MIQSFAYDALPARVVFGEGALSRLAQEVDALGFKRALVLTTPQQTQQGDDASAILGPRATGRYSKARMHVPIDIVDEAEAATRECNADSLVAIGGGSTTGLAKALALRTNLPIIAAPTTYAGSEMTPIWGMTEGGVKTTGRDMRVLPRLVIYDPDLLKTLPPDVVATSGMNAIAHCVEALYSQTANPITSLMAEEGIRAIAKALPRAAQADVDKEARAQVLYGAWLGGTVLGAVGMALHHKLCHTLGGGFDLPHARFIRSSFRMRPRSTQRLLRRPWDASPAPSAGLGSRTLPAHCSILSWPAARRRGSRRSEWMKLTSIRLRRSRCAIPPQSPPHRSGVDKASA